MSGKPEEIVAQMDHVEQPNERLERPFYAHVDDTRDVYKNRHEFEELHLVEGEKPSLAELIDTCIGERTSQFINFEQGMWVEYRSNDMKWKVGRVNRVIKEPPDDWDFDEMKGDPPDDQLEISYNIGVEGVVKEDNIRAPEVGLQAIFGMRPWLWQQFTLLQLEKRLRFDQYHEYDFEDYDKLKFATTRYEAWLNTFENADFKELHDAQPEITQKLLRSHILVPFDLMDFIAEKREQWDFKDPDINVYTYMGVLGSGIITSMTTFFIQVLTPIVLLYNNILQSDGGPSDRFFVNDDALPANGHFFPSTSFEDLCHHKDPGRLEGKILIILVLVIYISTVVPDSLLSFYRTSGGHKSTSSKINSLRNIIWEQNDDDFVQELGYKLDRMMNTGYLSVLYTIMLFILLNTPIVLDLILNALAIEFIHQIDERIADADWWDEDNRWIKAGTIELVIQGTLLLGVLRDPVKLCKTYKIDREKYKTALGGMKSLANYDLASDDDENPRYMTDKEVTFDKVAKDAAEFNDEFVLNEYRKSNVQFGTFDFLLTFFGRKQGMFQRYLKFRTWSRWEKILFLPALPADFSKSYRDIGAKKVNVTLGVSDMDEFLTHVRHVLTGNELRSTLQKAIYNRNYHQIPRKIVLGVMEWVLYLIHLLFPFVIVFCVAFVPICY